MSLPQSTIPLSLDWNIPDGAHIYYGYQNPEEYLQKAVSYICTGIRLGQRVLFVEECGLLRVIRERLETILNPEELERVHTGDRDVFYGTETNFQCQTVLNNLKRYIRPFLTEGIGLRLWGNVGWKDQQDLDKRLWNYKCQCDLTLSGLGFTTVWAYDANRLSAGIQNMLLKHHEFWMTDDTLVRSVLYRQYRGEPAQFPSLSRQALLESEVDLYKQKLDFAHVVSHEVRNPLTVIKAYAALLMAKVKDKDPSDLLKLKAISDYVDVIDNEIAHIINTEQMLSTEALWRKKLVNPKVLIQEVLEIMDIKARTENITIRSDLQLKGNETMMSNSMGFKLIVSNLIGNAIKYSEEGGLVTVTAESSGGFLKIDISDEGIGMSREQMELLFRKYEKLNEEKCGQGIGLFMVKKLSDHFGGTVEVWSKEGEGTSVYVTLPLQMDESCRISGM